MILLPPGMKWNNLAAKVTFCVTRQNNVPEFTTKQEFFRNQPFWIC
jgi:hypothetical protein